MSVQTTTGVRYLLAGAVALTLATACDSSGGDGSEEPVHPKLGNFTVVAGNGTAGAPEDGKQAAEQPLRDIKDIAVDGTGAVYVAANCRAYRIGEDGAITALYQQSDSFTIPPGQNRSSNRPSCVDTIAVDQAGTAYLGDERSQTVWRISRDGRRDVVAGVGAGAEPVALKDTEGLPATQVPTSAPRSMVVTPDSKALFVVYAYQGGGVIRRVEIGGAISSVAGTGDGAGRSIRLTAPTPARRTWIFGDGQLADDGQGGLLVGNGQQLLRVRGDQVKPAGVSFDGKAGMVPSRSRLPYGVLKLAAAPDGSVYFTNFEEISRLAPDGSLGTVAALPAQRCDDGDPLPMQDVRGQGLAVHDGTLYVAYPQCNRVLSIAPPGS